MKSDEQLTKIMHYVQPLFQDDPTGHDFTHMKRVARLASTIAAKENADIFICEAAAWLHDVGDHKLFTDTEDVLTETIVFLQSIGITDNHLDQIRVAIKDVSFSKGQIPQSLEGKIVQDADRLDAIGAIGIARTFAYGGAQSQLIYDDTNKQQTSIQHFYDKLLKLTERLHTATAKQIAIKRHQFMENYLEQFFQEWSF
ncbi:HD domain-containing protein [Lentibacillus sp. N15]|uniref:HD domain-containing protein n=1 Tax=Lentibacillus songyuanensis TaxID=3136161 RepID=UPI0031BB1691